IFVPPSSLAPATGALFIEMRDPGVSLRPTPASDIRILRVPGNAGTPPLFWTAKGVRKPFPFVHALLRHARTQKVAFDHIATFCVRSPLREAHFTQLPNGGNWYLFLPRQ
ncbi:MAG TPA: hypothetical protein VHY22_08910, partial [Chthoniobacteraceae bacterium]|nr:hypothetical protein [Chthoniobacteraceae bacterium]